MFPDDATSPTAGGWHLCHVFPPSHPTDHSRLERLHMMDPQSESPSVNWSALIASAIHPIRVGSVEALAYIGEPLSATDLTAIFDKRYHLSLVSYHLKCLAKLNVARKVRQRKVRGAVQTFYALR